MVVVQCPILSAKLHQCNHKRLHIKQKMLALPGGNYMVKFLKLNQLD